MVNQIVSAGETPVPQGAPEGFVPHAYRRAFQVPHEQRRVWDWLNDPATFTEGQVWPFRVEFVDGGFEPGVLNVHHGPLLNFAGAIGEVREPGEEDAGYRDLKYFYGSYAISPRLVRPTPLQFWVEGSGERTLLTLQVDSLVRRRFVRPWDLLQRVFWQRFPRWMGSDLGAGDRS
ncbi:hypothetical protein BH24ACT21_BH24ACT21_16430 [soil metagenome]